MLIGSILLGADDVVAAFVQARIPYVQHFGPFTAIGVVRRGVLVGGVVYHGYREIDRDIQVSIAFDDARWALPQTLRALFAYPFETLGCVRMTAIVARSNRRCRRFTEGVGFKLEGVARKAIGGAEDAFFYGLLREECRWVRNEANGKISALAATAA